MLELTGTKHYNHLGRERTKAKQAEYRAWVHSHTPAQIHAANIARANLRRLLTDPANNKLQSRQTARIVDDRQPKSFRNAYNYFSSERFASGDMKSISITDAAKLIGVEWKSITAAEKKVCCIQMRVRNLCLPVIRNMKMPPRPITTGTSAKRMQSAFR
jgi:hypothetical protein